MRSEKEMLDLILDTAREDERIRAVILNGSRANPEVPGDIFQDFDIVYIVTDIQSFIQTPEWIERFGKLMILQLPDEMGEHPRSKNRYAYLMQFVDGNRIDLTLYPVAIFDELVRDSLSVLLLDKDGIFEPFSPSNECDYFPTPPTQKSFVDSCNEFWWISTYIAKGLWREEITYAKGMFEQYLRPELMKMLTWYIGMGSDFSFNPGVFGRTLKLHLEPALWEVLLDTYSDSDIDKTWEALEAACSLFRTIGQSVAEHFSFTYLKDDDENVTSHLKQVRTLPRDAEEIYGESRE